MYMYCTSHSFVFSAHSAYTYEACFDDIDMLEDEEEMPLDEEMPSYPSHACAPTSLSLRQQDKRMSNDSGTGTDMDDGAQYCRKASSGMNSDSGKRVRAGIEE